MSVAIFARCHARNIGKNFYKVAFRGKRQRVGYVNEFFVRTRQQCFCLLHSQARNKMREFLLFLDGEQPRQVFFADSDITCYVAEREREVEMLLDIFFCGGKMRRKFFVLRFAVCPFRLCRVLPNKDRKVRTLFPRSRLLPRQLASQWLSAQLS